MERRRQAAVLRLDALVQARMARIATWRVEHMDDGLLQLDYVPTDPRFRVQDPPRTPQAPATEADIKSRRRILECAKRVRDKVAEIGATDPRNRGRLEHLTGELNKLFEDEREARVKANEMDAARAARTRAMLATGQLTVAVEVPAPPVPAKAKR